jgi:hypothetical protein
MTMIRTNYFLLLSTLLVQSVVAFAPSTTIIRSTRLNGYIESDSVDAEYESGGLDLAIENTILVSGSVDKKGTAIAKEMKHFSKVINTDLASSGCKVFCKGEGQEIYKDPGLSTEKIISLAPYSAVENALNSIESENKDGDIFINFTGGDDLMLHEVLGSIEKLVSGLGLSSKVQFNSLCEPSFPMEKCSVVAVSSGDCNGQIYYNSGSWFTLSDDDAVSILE